MNGERDKIMEKRSSLRSWRERGGKLPEHSEYIIVGVIALVLFALVGYPYLSNRNETKSTAPQINVTVLLNTEQPAKTSAPVKTPVPTTPPPTTLAPKPQSQASAVIPAVLPAPAIRLASPENTTYNTSTPPLNFVVAGSSLDSVLLSVDGGENKTVPHDGSLVSENSFLLSQAFKDDFSAGAGRWTPAAGDWSVKDGRYVPQITENVAVFSVSGFNPNSTRFAVESTARQVGGTSGNGFIIFSYKSKDDFYYAGIYVGRKEVAIGKYDGKPSDKKILTVDSLKSNKDYNLRAEVEDGSVALYLDGVKTIDYDFGELPEGKAGVMTSGSITEFDDFSVYTPLVNGMHNLTIFANNTAGNSSSLTVFFTINAAAAKTEKTEVEKIGGMKENITKNDLDVTLKAFNPSFEIKTGSGRTQTSTLYARIDVELKNMGKDEIQIKLDPKSVLIDNKGEQHIYAKTNHIDELKEATLYPGARIKGAVFFSPAVSFNVKNLKLILLVNNIKYEFAFNNA